LRIVARPFDKPVARSESAVQPGAIAHLRRADPRLARVIRRVGPLRLTTGRAGGYLAALSRTIVHQQLSGKAASSIFARLRAVFGTGPFPDPRAILAATDAELGAAGLSRQKIASLRDLCGKVAGGTLVLDGLESSSDAEVVDRLTRVKGIGRWSAQMFLIFDLGRPDVWPESDLGIRKAVKRLCDLDDLPSVPFVADFGERFAPYRTVASLYLWRSIDGEAGDW
jgi:DNA-3-methyladenine glycosylase II